MHGNRNPVDVLAAARPASVYIIGYGESTINVLRHLREHGYNGLICATSAFYTNQIVDDHPELVEGVFFPQPAFDVKTEGDLAQDFVAAYRQRSAWIPTSTRPTPTTPCGS